MPTAKKSTRLTTLWLLLFCFSIFANDLNLKIFDGSGTELTVPSLIDKLQDTRVVWIGENHDRYDNHVAELEIIRRLHETAPQRWVIGVEFIQRKFQPALTEYIKGRIDEHEFLKRTEYFDRWGFDYRLYQRVFSYARENGIEVIALNAEAELSERVGKV